MAGAPPPPQVSSRFYPSLRGKCGNNFSFFPNTTNMFKNNTVPTKQWYIGYIVSGFRWRSRRHVRFHVSRLVAVESWQRRRQLSWQGEVAPCRGQAPLPHWAKYRQLGYLLKENLALVSETIIILHKLHLRDRRTDGRTDAGNRIWCILSLKCDIWWE